MLLFSIVIFQLDIFGRCSGLSELRELSFKDDVKITSVIKDLKNVGASKKTELGDQAREVLREFERDEELAVGVETRSFAKPVGLKRRFTQSTELTDKIARDSRLDVRLQEKQSSVASSICNQDLPLYSRGSPDNSTRFNINPAIPLGSRGSCNNDIRKVFGSLSPCSGSSGGGGLYGDGSGGPSSNVRCRPDDPYRRMDGLCNNLRNKEFGAAGIPLRRILPNAYDDRFSVPRGGFNPSSLPNPRSISAALHQDPNVLSIKGITHMTMQFGQFLAHDFTLTAQGELDCCNIPEPAIPSLRRCFNIDVSGDPFYTRHRVSCHPFTRSDSICTKTNIREQLNGITAFIDASNVYGSSEKTGSRLRTLTDGLLKVNTDKHNPSLPTRQQCGFSSSGGQQPSDLVAGDVRVIVQPTLASIHTLFMNEHNRIAKELKRRLSQFLNGKTNSQKDEILFQESRKIIIAEMQNIVYNEYLPVVLGKGKVISNQLNLRDNSAYNQNVDPSIINEFATVAFRFGHSLISGFFQPIGHSSWPLRFHFFEFDDFVLNQAGNGWKNEMRGVIQQKCPAADRHVTEDVTNFLFDDHINPNGFGDDLIARNIQRGRDHGIPSYNKLRSICGLPTITSFYGKPAEISNTIWNKLMTVYDNVNDIDGYTGGLSEISISDGLVGPTFACIFVKQFNHLMYGDRFFFTHTSGSANVRGLKPKSKSTVRRRTLGDIMCDNADITDTQRNVFKEESATNPRSSCSSRSGLNFDDIVSEISSKSSIELTTTKPDLCSMCPCLAFRKRRAAIDKLSPVGQFPPIERSPPIKGFPPSKPPIGDICLFFCCPQPPKCSPCPSCGSGIIRHDIFKLREKRADILPSYRIGAKPIIAGEFDFRQCPCFCKTRTG